MREQDGLPCTGLCVDRRQQSQVAEAVHSDNIKSYMCLCCAQIRTYVRNWECAYDCSDTLYEGSGAPPRRQRWCSWETRADIRMISVEKSLWWMFKKDPDAFVDNFGMDLFKQRYARDLAGNTVNPFLNATHFDEDNYEWQRKLLLPDGKASMRILCCPEDATLGTRCKHASHVLCGNC